MRFDPILSIHKKRRKRPARAFAGVRYGKLALTLLACAAAICGAWNARAVSKAGGSPDAPNGGPTSNAQAVFQQYCVQCHGGKAPKAGVNLERLTAQLAAGEGFDEWQQWEKVVTALERKSMP